MTPRVSSRAESWSGKRVHFVGIGGAGMSGAARILLAAGAHVSGSDQNVGPVTDALAKLGASVAVQHDPSHVPEACDLVVISAAIPGENPELLAAQSRGLRIWKYARLLGELSRAKRCLAVSGTHGKTTTASMLAYALQEAGLDPEVVVGGRVEQIGGSVRLGKGRHFVVEACEYDRSFLNLSPRIAVINNIDIDHLDFFRDMDDLVDAFASLASQVHPKGKLLINGDDMPSRRAAEAASCRVETFGMSDRCDWRFGGACRRGGRTRFQATRRGADLGRFWVRPPGLHNCYNAMAAVAVAVSLGASLPLVRSALERFLGADRRLQKIARLNGIDILDDYAHHPTEVRATLAAVRAEYGDRRVWCVFQPHQCSRTRILLEQFAASFENADRVIVPRIYSVRDTENDRATVSAEDLAARIRANGRAAEPIPEFNDAVVHLIQQVEPGDVVVTMGAGPVDTVAWSLARRLEQAADVAAA